MYIGKLDNFVESLTLLTCSRRKDSINSKLNYLKNKMSFGFQLIEPKDEGFLEWPGARNLHRFGSLLHCKCMPSIFF